MWEVESIFTLKSITCEFRVSHKMCIIFHALEHWCLPLTLPQSAVMIWCDCWQFLFSCEVLLVRYPHWSPSSYTGLNFSVENYSLFLDDEGGTRCGLLLWQPICSRVQCDVHTDISELLLPFYQINEVSPLTSGVNNASSRRELALTEYFLFFGQFSINPRDGSVGKSK